MNIYNLLNLATMACAEIYSKKDFDAPEKALKALENKEMYGDVPKDIKDHLYNILSANCSHARR